MRYDLIVIGGGIVGLAVAYEFLKRRSGASAIVLEKEADIALHQTGRNSGVIHSGIYYKPGSLKARNCRRGKELLLAFAREHEVQHEVCGKVVVALNALETERLTKVYERGQANGVDCRKIRREELLEHEPHVAGVAALHVPETGIIDYIGVCRALQREIERTGGTLQCNAQVTALTEEGEATRVTSQAGEFLGSLVVNCAGLHSDRIAALGGHDRPARIVPFRGEYFEIKESAQHLCRHLIYPVPDPSFPFLGVHFTRMVMGGVECGPNAVLAFAREGYTKLKISPRDLWDTLSYGGFWRLAGKHWKTGTGEMWRSISKRAFVHALQKLIPEIESKHLVAAPAGVRAQALSRDGGLVDDFLIEERGRTIHVCNAPSPAATSCLAIGEAVVDRLDRLTARET